MELVYGTMHATSAPNIVEVTNIHQHPGLELTNTKVKNWLRSLAFVLFILLQSLLVLREFFRLEFFDIVEYEVIQQNVICLFLVANFGAALRTLIEIKDKLCQTEFAEGVLASGRHRMGEIILTEEAEDTDPVQSFRTIFLIFFLDLILMLAFLLLLSFFRVFLYLFLHLNNYYTKATDKRVTKNRIY